MFSISTGLLSKNRRYHNSESYLVQEVQNGMIPTVIVLISEATVLFAKEKKTLFITNLIYKFIIKL